MKERIWEYIKENYNYNQALFTSEIREKFLDIKEGTIRQILRRLREEGKLTQAGPGIYFVPKRRGVLNKTYISFEEISDEKFILKKIIFLVMKQDLTLLIN